MDQAVIIKSERSGIHLILNPDLSFEQLLEAIVQKFIDSEKFFKNAKVSISFGGRSLSEAEENQIIDTITANTSIRILCILDHDAIIDEVIRQKTEAVLHPATQEIVEQKEPDISNIYKGSLSEGQVLECNKSILILGDVPASATIISTGNVVVLGQLLGNVQAGASEDHAAFIAATLFEPARIMIGTYCYKEKKRTGLFSKRNRNKTQEARIAHVSGGIIHIDSFDEFSF